MLVQQAEAETDQVVKVGHKLFQELGERSKRLEIELNLYREMTTQMATLRGVEVPDFVKDENTGLGEEQAGRLEQLREWLGRLFTGEETTVGRRGRLAPGGKPGRGTSRGKRPRGGKDDDGGMVH